MPNGSPRKDLKGLATAAAEDELLFMSDTGYKDAFPCLNIELISVLCPNLGNSVAFNASDS